MAEDRGPWFDEAAAIPEETWKKVITRPQPHNPPGTGKNRTRKRNERRKRHKAKIALAAKFGVSVPKQPPQ